MSRFGTFDIAGVTYDLDDLTLDEIEQIEEHSGGVPFSEVNYGSAKGMKAFAYVLMKRNNPDLTMEDVGKVKVISLAPPDEEMPDLPPVPSATQSPVDDPNGSVADGSGTQLSAVSTDG